MGCHCEAKPQCARLVLGWGTTREPRGAEILFGDMMKTLSVSWGIALVCDLVIEESTKMRFVFQMR
jgi:hypothetical protein